MKIIQRFIPAGRRNRPMTFRTSSLFGKTMIPKAVTIHNTGSATGNAAAHASYILSDACANRPASWHYTVDDKELWQHLPNNESGWHAGDNLGPGNTTTIGIEICQHRGIDQAKANDNAAWLTAKLLTEFKLTIEDVKQHNHWSGKNCPAVLRSTPNGWRDFLSLVEKHLRGNITQPLVYFRVVAGSFTNRANADATMNELNQLGYSAFLLAYTPEEE